MNNYKATLDAVADKLRPTSLTNLKLHFMKKQAKSRPIKKKKTAKRYNAL